MSSTSLFKWMGLGQQSGGGHGTKPAIDNDAVDEGERYFGLENSTHPNSPMSNGHSYFPTTSSSTTSSSPSLNPKSGTSTPNRENPNKRSSNVTSSTLPAVIEKDQNNINLAPGMEDTLFSSLKDLFWKISQNKKKNGVIAPVNFINKLFRSSMHQDAHEFLNYTLNTIAEDVQKYQQKIADENESKQGSANSDSQTDSTAANPAFAAGTGQNPKNTWVHQLFEGVFSNETKCLSCETVTSRDECFMDLSIDVEMNSSITSCLRQFSASETLCHKNKYFCDVCSGLQEAEKRMKIKKLPNILALHLKRFKYQEQLQKYIKLTYRVVFPFELRLFNTSDDTEDADRMYELWAIVVHIGSGPHHGHYVAIIKSNGQWMLFDDDVVTQIQEEDIQKYFSDLPGSGSGYVLFYQAVDLNMDAINIGLERARKMDESNNNQSNGGPSELSSQHPTATNPVNSLGSDNNNNDNDINAVQREEHNNIPTPESTPPPASAPQAPQPEEKKTRWGLGRKKKDKK
ncbi:hypothetical protein [Parasitella parasitica]|uniref:ubiquitinyl hydrolase 1 n=1 Tax=Parasitella parasitica TaxID=35722 RepID=A0A0B7NMT2_9FUNG|nr:hypothetical protein [Parasitella parasitica]